ncbi:MAG: hypothetical protein IKN63_01015 [Bacilli bacterium]|nr:hypothetical protein [Bacilli bacterium]
MKNLEIEETKNIIGGAFNLTGSFVSAFKGIVTALFEIGQTLGGAIRRISSNHLCDC